MQKPEVESHTKYDDEVYDDRQFYSMLLKVPLTCIIVRFSRFLDVFG